MQISSQNAPRNVQMHITLVWMALAGPEHHPEHPDGPESGGKDVSLCCHQLLVYQKKQPCSSNAWTLDGTMIELMFQDRG